MYSILSIPVGSYQANCYILESAGEILVLDPGAEPNILLANLTPAQTVGLVITHFHSDHCGAVNELVAATGAPVMAGEADIAGLSDPEISGFAEEGSDYRVTNVSRALADGDVITWGTNQLRVFATPGHTPGSICLWDEANGYLFTGDTLFANGIGRTDFILGDPAVMPASIARLGQLPDSTVVLPGHGPRTTIGVERLRNRLLGGPK